MANLWRLRVACLLLLSVGASRSCGGCTACLLIMIRGPNLSQPLPMTLSSSAMVDSCAGDAWLTSIVNFFIFPSIVSAGPSGLALIAVGTGTGGYFHKFIAPGKYQTRARLYPTSSQSCCQACCSLVAGSFLFFSGQAHCAGLF